LVSGWFVNFGWWCPARTCLSLSGEFVPMATPLAILALAGWPMYIASLYAYTPVGWPSSMASSGLLT